MKDEVKMIPIREIRILNPRHRDPKKFALIVQSIKNLGLKKPIQVSRRAPDEKEGPGYDLVYGQGRIEAYKALGYSEIPALVVDITKEDRMLRSLVENMARRWVPFLALMNEIERLKRQGYANVEIAKKLDMDDTTVGGYLTLANAGEERVLDAVIAGRIPLSIGMEIARTEGAETQRELLKAYESKQLNQGSLRTVKRLLDQRRFVGKGRDKRGSTRKRLTSAESLVTAYKRESQKQKLMIKKAKVCETRLVFIIRALKKLLADEHFITLLKAESLFTMPKYVADRLGALEREAA